MSARESVFVCRRHMRGKRKFCGLSRAHKFCVHFNNLHRYPSSPVMKTILSYYVVFGSETENCISLLISCSES